MKFDYMIIIIFAMIMYLSIFQIYIIKIKDSYVSLFMLMLFFLLPFAIKYIKILRWKPLLAISLLMFFQGLSLFWSNDMKLGLKNLLHFSIFLIIVLSSYSITNRYPHRMRIILISYFFLILMPSYLVIAFQIYPQQEMAFLHSSIAKLFINPNIIDSLMNGARNNIFDPNKAGGLFTNANVAAAFLGINALVSYAFSKAYTIRWLKLITIFLIISVIFTGSKAGLILVILLIGTIIFLPKIVINNRRLTLHRVINILFLSYLSFFILLVIAYQFSNSEFIHHIAETTSIRTLIWNYGFTEFLHHPIFGLGFGGWQRGFADYAEQMGINPNFPPHNTLIYLWAQSGLIAVILALWFIFEIIKFTLRLIKAPDKELNGLGLGLLGAYLWTFIHGMGTNFGLVGELHMEVILAVLLGYSLSRYRSRLIRIADVW